MAVPNRLTLAGKRELAALIRSTRKRLGLNQTQFGRLIGVGQRVISNWELGKALSAVHSGILLQRLLDRRMPADTNSARLREANAQLDALLAADRPRKSGKSRRA